MMSRGPSYKPITITGTWGGVKPQSPAQQGLVRGIGGLSLVPLVVRGIGGLSVVLTV